MQINGIMPGFQKFLELILRLIHTIQTNWEIICIIFDKTKKTSFWPKIIKPKFFQTTSS